MTHDYFYEGVKDLDIQDILLHAILTARHSKNKIELIMAIVFYVKHKNKMDVRSIRRRAQELGISGIWLDIEAYIHRRLPKNASLFLPWDEFLSKARLYEIPTKRYTLPRPAIPLFQEIGERLQKTETVYLFGGENMRIKSLKHSTKDCDIIIESKDIFENLVKILISIGYKRIIKTEYSDEDMRMKPDDIFEHAQKSRVDLFTHTIMHELSLSPSMKKRADIIHYKKLNVRLLRNEDVFLLKAVACREGDIEDMALLVTGSPDTPEHLQHGSFNWSTVWEEILVQERICSTGDFTMIIFEQISYLAEQTGIVAPFLDRLKNHVVDVTIVRMLRGGSIRIKEIVKLLEGGDIVEQTIRNRIDALESSGTIKKCRTTGITRVQLVQNNEYPITNITITMHRFKRYLDWRFLLRPKSPDQDVMELV